MCREASNVTEKVKFSGKGFGEISGRLDKSGLLGKFGLVKQVYRPVFYYDFLTSG